VLDIAFIRENPDVVRAAIQSKGERVDLDALLATDAERRRLLAEVERMRAEQNRVSKEIGLRKRQGQEASDVIASMRDLGDRIQALQDQVRQAEAGLRDLVVRVPNIPAADVPQGRDAADNVVVRTWSEPKRFPFKPKAHWDLGRDLDILDFERAAKLSGSHFALFKAAGAHMERALVNFMLDLHTREHGSATPCSARANCPNSKRTCTGARRTTSS
jgi:seryl-tRNA synthetase